ncbi:unnamed protein product [Ascophyllum nodosum]
MGVAKMLSALALITFTATYMLPTSLHLAFGPDLPAYTYPAIALVLGLPASCYMGAIMWYAAAENRRIRKAKRQMEAIEEQTYGCIQPQVLDSFVVFPVRVNKRGCSASSWVEIGEQAVVVNLCASLKVTGAVDTEGPLRRLCEATFGEDLGVIVYCGGGKAGPTGLAVGVGRKGFGRYLASRVAQGIMEAMRLGKTTQ